MAITPTTLQLVWLDKLNVLVMIFFWPIDHYIRYLETLASLKINANGLISTSISYCDDMYLCQSG